MPKKQVNPKLLSAAILFLAFMSSAVGFFMLSERLNLLDKGEQTHGIVIGVDVGVKGAKSVEVEFKTADGRLVTGRDIHKTQWFAANDIGEKVTLTYDPNNPENILVMRGIWIWSNPAFLLAAGVFLIGLAVFILRHPPSKRL